MSAPTARMREPIGEAERRLENVLDVRSFEALWSWLERNHAAERACWVACRRGKPPTDGALWYVDAVEAALCFGWIDTTLKRMPDGVALQKLMPRRKKSRWSELNRERARRMERLGFMTDAGRAVLPKADFVADEDVLEALRADAAAWENFQRFPELYRRVRLDNLQRCRGDGALFERRLSRLIETAGAGVMYGMWNDYGRLGEGDFAVS